MVNAVVPLFEKDVPKGLGWLQFEKKAVHELRKLAMKSPAAMATLMFLIENMSRSNALVISQAAIAKGVSARRESVSRAIAQLERLNFIQVIKIGAASVYVVNSKVVWQGNRGERYAAFGADILAVESEQSSKVVDDKTPLKSVPVLHEGERILVGNEPLDPPDQQEMDLT